MELIIIILALSFVFAIFQEKIKGILGEKAVARNLSGLPANQYKLLNDIMLKTEYGTTQIDHIVVSIYGIFVIETKNYKGWITGSEYGEQWTKNMYGKKYSFRNPIKQNYAHVKAMEKKTGLAESDFIPIVAFSRNSEIKVKTSKPVVYIGQVKRVIQSYHEMKFSEGKIEEIANNILSANITSKDAKKQHVKQIKTEVNNQKNMISNNICPKCGGTLIKRKGKYGTFIGCSNYPKCRYTKS